MSDSWNRKFPKYASRRLWLRKVCIQWGTKILAQLRLFYKVLNFFFLKSGDSCISCVLSVILHFMFIIYCYCTATRNDNEKITKYFSFKNYVLKIYAGFYRKIWSVKMRSLCSSLYIDKPAGDQKMFAPHQFPFNRCNYSRTQVRNSFAT